MFHYVQEVIRAEGRTEAIVDEGIAVVSYALDDVRIDTRIPLLIFTTSAPRSLP
jgi:hypothetical protein